MNTAAMPSQEMMAVPVAIAEFIKRGGRDLPENLFARDAVIVESFAPFIFRDPVRWAAAMRVHLQAANDLHYTIGPPQEFTSYANMVYFSLPTTWGGINCGVPFHEVGAFATVLRYEAESWRLAAYGWTVLEAVSYPSAQ